jgi:predicted nucleic acid-binding Zn ribbon protein
MSTPQPSTAAGVDLARQALARARAAAKTTHTPTKTRGPKRARRQPGTGRDPQPLAGVLGHLTADEGWTDHLHGGSILDRWTQLCPSVYATTTQPVGYDPATGTLTIRAHSHTVAAHLRLMGRQLATYINDQLGKPVVRQIRVGVGSDTAQPTTAVAAAPIREPEQLVKTRETASAGYRAALEALHTHRTEPQPADPYLAEAVARQEAALRAHREPETEHRDAVWELDRATAEPDRSEMVRRAALARKRAEQTGTAAPRRARDVA